jgi:hypothetical protein
MSHFVALTCSALARSVYAAAATADAAVSVRLFDQGLHNVPKNLRARLQAAIDAVQPGECDAILLVYGICGAATVGLTARHTALVLPRAHDCITLYLGSKERYQEEFDTHPGTYWYSQDYLERNPSNSAIALGAASLEVSEALYQSYVQKYGPDNADYLMEVMGEWGNHYDRAVFIDTGLSSGTTFEAVAREQAQRRHWTFERKAGDRHLVTKLLNGDWADDEFLFVRPNHHIMLSHDSGLIQASL